MILCHPEGIWNIAFVAQPLILKCHFAAQIAIKTVSFLQPPLDIIVFSVCKLVSFYSCNIAQHIVILR